MPEIKNLRSIYRFIVLMVIVITVVSCKKTHTGDSGGDVITIKATGDITAKLNEFRQVLGATLNTAPGAVGGHREINWDGVPDSLLGKPLPNDFFNPVGTDASLASRQRGLAYEAVGQFMVTNNVFATVNSLAAPEFRTFSGTNSFANIGSNLWQIDPRVAGTATNATIKGMGIVFSDVDLANSTSIEFFTDTKSLGKFFVPQHDNTTSFSFLGVYFKNEKVTHVRVKHDGFLVILDDFLYDEPVKQD
jgi:hypothetical protein